MATKKSTATEHVDRDSLTTSAVADPHAKAFAERQRDPNRYENPTIATPGVLGDIDEDDDERMAIAGRTTLVDPDAPSDLDPSVDNRDQVQPMLDTIAESVGEDPAQATYAINAHESDAVDVEALNEEAAAKREENREALAKQREEARSAQSTTSSSSASKK
jgi:hypothetical protein